MMSKLAQINPNLTHMMLVSLLFYWLSVVEKPGVAWVGRVIILVFKI